MTDTASATNGHAKQTRGNGPIRVTYVDTKGDNTHKRVPADVAGVVVTTASGATKTYLASQVPDSVKVALQTYALSKIMGTYMINNSEEDDASDAIGLADKVFGSILDGKMYLHAGDGTGKKAAEYDPSDWVQAFEAAANEVHRDNPEKPKPTQELLEKLRHKLTVEYTGRARTAYIQSNLKNKPIINKYYVAIQARKKKDAAKASGKAMTDLMDGLF